MTALASISHPLGVLVVDDERPARAHVIRLLGADPRYRLVGEARDGLEALERIDQLAPELVVLDVQMPGLDGFELLEAAADRPFHVLFSTASDAHALRAFDAHALDYLLKPYDEARFRRALDRAYAQHLGSRAQPPHAALLRAMLPGTRARLALRTRDGAWVQLACDDIVRVSAADKHLTVVTRHGQHSIRMTLRELVARLDERFVQVHRGDIVNVQAVLRVEPWDHGDALLLLEGGAKLVLTRTFRRAFHQRFGACETGRGPLARAGRPA